MPIREKGYYSWEGKLKEGGIKWLPIFFNGIKSVFRKKKSKLLFAFTTFPFIVFLIAVYAATKPELRMFTRLVRQISTDALLFHSFYTFGPLMFGMVILSLFAGAELISGDLKFKSFTLYLSRPLSKLDYIKGKFSIVLFYLLLFSLVPGILLIIAKIVFTGEFSVSINVILAAVVFPLIISFFMASWVLMFSSLSANVKFVYIMFFAFYFVSNTLAAVFGETFRNDNFYLFSIERNIKQFGSYVFNTKPDFNAPAWLSGVVLISVTVIFFFVLMMRLRKTEV